MLLWKSASPALDKASDDRVERLTAVRDLSATEVEHVAGGSRSSGAGAGKITFNPFSITR